jgi:HPt (histidine-containing phosphotransfer) domain-containing protein
VISRSAIDRLYETVGSDPQSLVEMIDCFLEEGPMLVGQISAASVSGDFLLMRRCAHTLKSNARDFGASALADLCEALEDDLRQRAELADPGARVAPIGAQWQQVEAALRGIAVEWSR